MLRGVVLGVSVDTAVNSAELILCRLTSLMLHGEILPLYICSKGLIPLLGVDHRVYWDPLIYP